MSVKYEDLDYIYNNLSAEEKGKLKDSTVLITGCAGFLGYYFLGFLERFGSELNIRGVIALDSFILGKPKWLERLGSNALYDIGRFDVSKDEIGDIAGAESADLIIHMASIASPTYYRQYPIETMDANVRGLRSLLDFYRDRDIKGLLFFSSSEIYGDPDDAHIPTDEEYRGFVSPTGPRACYDESKRFGETLCMLFAQEYGMPIGVARPFNNYGPGMRLTDKRVPADFAKAIYENKDIVILSDGSPTRTFCYIADAITGYLKVLLHGKYDCFNIGIDKPEISIRRLAETFVSAGGENFGYTGKAIFGASDDKQYLTHNPRRRSPVIDKAKKILNYAPTVEVGEGVERFLRYIKEEYQNDFGFGNL
jgi:UDP-glucuronate decarboxylase